MHESYGILCSLLPLYIIDIAHNYITNPPGTYIIKCVKYIMNICNNVITILFSFFKVVLNIAVVYYKLSIAIFLLSASKNPFSTYNMYRHSVLSQTYV